MATLGMSMPVVSARATRTGAGSERSVILLLMVGGPSQLETWDPKPEASADIRGPFGSIATRIPGIRFNEFLPKMAARADRLAIVRSMTHDSAPIHETGLQLLQTGRVCRAGEGAPELGEVVGQELGSVEGLPASVVLPGPIDHLGVSISRGQPSGPVERADRPKLRRALNLNGEPSRVRELYGRGRFGESCLRARRLLEAGVRLVTVNMFTDVFHRVSWDCHGSRPFSTLEDYRREVLPAFDQGYSALIDDLERSGRLDSTLVVASGEFGRTPRLNAAGGRDHWPGAWSAALCGGDVRGGTIVGATDAIGAEPVDRPVSPAELLAAMYRHLGIDRARMLAADDPRLGSRGGKTSALAALGV